MISALELVELVPHCACYNVAATTRITMITITEKRLLLLLLQIMLVLLLLLLLARLPRLSAVEPSLCKRAGRLSMRLLCCTKLNRSEPLRKETLPIVTTLLQPRNLL